MIFNKGIKEMCHSTKKAAKDIGKPAREKRDQREISG
jgi:hypothetical protein